MMLRYSCYTVKVDVRHKSINFESFRYIVNSGHYILSIDTVRVTVTLFTTATTTLYGRNHDFPNPSGIFPLQMKTDMFILSWSQYPDPSFSFITYYLIYIKSNMTGAISGAVTAFPSSAHEFTPVFSEVRLLLNG